MAFKIPRGRLNSATLEASLRQLIHEPPYENLRKSATTLLRIGFSSKQIETIYQRVAPGTITARLIWYAAEEMKATVVLPLTPRTDAEAVALSRTLRINLVKKGVNLP